MIDSNTQDKTQSKFNEGECPMNQEVKEILAKIDEYNELIDNAENALDAAIENLEEALVEANEE